MLRGRDLSISDVAADTAEAGLFQQRWESRFASPELPKLFARYSANPQGLFSIFAEGIKPKLGELDGNCEGLQDRPRVGLSSAGGRLTRRHRSPGHTSISLRRRFSNPILPNHQPDKDRRWR
jgi:hypothetical protein